MVTKNNQPKPRQNNKASKPKETGATGNTGNSAGADNPLDNVETGSVVLMRRDGRGNVTGTNNIFRKVSAERSRDIAAKHQIVQDSKQRLAEAFDLFKEGTEKAEEAREVASKAGAMLYQARSTGSLSADEVSSALGEVFGFKSKKDGSPSKTPQGAGEEIRKRIVRLTAARDFVNGDDEPGFFTVNGTAIDPETESTVERSSGWTISGVIEAVEEGSLSIWSAYEYLADIKKTASDKPLSAAFDAKKVAAMVEALSEDGAAEKVRDNPTLIAAYGALIDVLSVIGEEPESEAGEAAAA